MCLFSKLYDEFAIIKKVSAQRRIFYGKNAEVCGFIRIYLISYGLFRGGQQASQNEPAENPPAIAPISGEGIVIKNGMVQQIASYTDPMTLE